ncbi:hypothetical protein [Pseudoalteromonas sp. XMcav11-Q]|uniref:HD domain-containing protein n=1 Tax=Pseudoalteromonas sp. XMcav11-Q TaxID=3136665 RepID=UPI0032C4178A
MGSLIRNRLEELCSKDPGLNVLWAQWIFDEKLVSKALQNISQTFPHYSIHDDSHSNQIITNIERLLGEENICLLSATDLWLILESAYYHDIGMVVPFDEIEADWESDGFQEFIREVQVDDSHELNEIAVKYSDKKFVDSMKAASSLVTVCYEVKLLQAEFYRKKHASRSEVIAINPFKEISLTSPRNELLPARLFKILGKVSSHHGLSFEDVMKLPKMQVGVGNDEMHPRYIACLLRLGDLLDLDNNRFCPVMQRTAGCLPKSTKAHMDKHMAIEEFVLNTNRIDVFANCETYEGYNATASWFQYLKEEISKQMMNWDEIVPNKKMGLLPTVGNLDIKLKDYEILDGNHVPRFEVDSEKMLDLMQGAGLYKDSFQSIRELLQNAVDATLLRIWCENSLSQQSNTIDLTTPSEKTAHYIKTNYFIEVEIKLAEERDESVLWKVVIRDRGVGFDKGSIKYLQKMGSSSRNIQKHKLIDEMPSWLKPSGAFGIGLHSIFMLTDKIELKTKGFFDEEAFELVLENPSNDGRGNIFIRNIDKKYSQQVGTELSFTYQSPKVPGGFRYSADNKRIISEMESFDLTKSNSLHIDTLNIIHEVKSFFKQSPVSGVLNFNNQEHIYDEGVLKDDFFESGGIGVELLNVSSDDEFQSPILFKGQKLETSIETAFLAFRFDLHDYKATDILEINRNKIKNKAQERVFEDIYKAAVEFVLINQEICLSKGASDDLVSAFLINAHLEYKDQNFLSNAPKAVPDLTFSQEDDVKTADIISWDQVTLKYRKESDQAKRERQGLPWFEVDKDNKVILTKLYTRSPVFNIFTEYLLPKHFPGVELDYSDQIENEMVDSELSITYRKSDTCIYNDSIYRKINEICKSGYLRWARMVCICPTEFKELQVKKNSLTYADYFENFIHRSKYVSHRERMVLPFTQGDDTKIQLENLVEWVYENRLDSNTTKESIIAAYERFMSKYNEINYPK